MHSLSGFSALSLIASNPVHQLYRAVRVRDQQPVILKALDATKAGIHDQARLRHEYRLLSRDPQPGWVRALELLQDEQMLVLVLEDDRAEDLEKVIRHERIPLSYALEMMLGLVETVGMLHQQGIVHRDINPSNMILLREQRCLKLIDFGIAIETLHGISDEGQTRLMGSLQYIAPEQTGKMNRQVDYRADFYALGVTFYEILSGHPPFENADPHELIHAHIARRPTPLVEVDDAIPCIVSDLVMKLLEKNAEQRYQSSHGLRLDLQRCLTLLQEKGLAALQQANWPLAEQDRTAHYALSEKLYGREKELQILQRGFANVRQGKKSLFLVHGDSGAGKTALVRELNKTVLDSNGALVIGKFDQMQRDIPNRGWVLALQQWLKQLFSASETVVQQWRNVLQKAIDDNSHLLLEAIPELRWLIGENSTQHSMDPIQQQQLFIHLMLNLLGAIANAEHPLVVALDDVQWADAGSLMLLERIMAAEDVSHLMIVCIYRHNEVASDHPFQLTLNALQQRHAVADSLSVDALPLVSLEQLVADTFAVDNRQARELAELVFDKTQGNPFYVEEFLSNLVAEQQIEFDFINGVWQWDVQQLTAAAATLNVVELLVQRLHHQDEITLRVLQTASCCGFEFLLQDLLAVSQLEPGQVISALKNATQQNLLQPVGDAYLADAEQPDLSVIRAARFSYRFIHDQIQQAVYENIAPAEQSQLHCRMAFRLYQALDEQDRHKRIFEIARHFNAAVELLQEAGDIFTYLQVNYAAALKAIADSGFDKAYRLLAQASTKLEAIYWQLHYTFAVAFQLKLIEAAYLCEQYDEMNQQVKVLERKVQDPIDAMPAYHIQMHALNRQGRTQEAVDLGIERCSVVAVSLDKNPSNLRILIALVRAKYHLSRKLRGRKMMEMQLPAAVDNKRQAALYNHLYEIAELAFLARPNVFAEITMVGVSTTVDYGIKRASPGAYIAFGLLHCAMLNQIEKGFDFARFALRAAEQINEPGIMLATVQVHNGFVRHWKEPLRDSLRHLLWVQRYATEVANLGFSCHGANMFLLHSYFCGANLQELSVEAERFSKLAHRYGYDNLGLYPELILQTLLSMQGMNSNPCAIQGDVFKESNFDVASQEGIDPTLVTYYYLFKLQLTYLFGEYEAATEYATAYHRVGKAAPGAYAGTLLLLYEALAYVQTALRMARYRRQARGKLSHALRRFRFWSQYCPANFNNKLALLDGAKAMLSGRWIEGVQYFEKAAMESRAQGFVQERALALELAAQCAEQLNIPTAAQEYWNDAVQYYQYWGAQAKVRQLQKSRLMGQKRGNSLRHTITAGEADWDSLDIAALRKALKEIAEEKVHSRLLGKTIVAAAEFAGSQNAILLLEHDGELRIEAQLTSDMNAPSIMKSIPMQDDSEVMVVPVVHYVCRAHGSIVIADALQMQEQIPGLHKHPTVLTRQVRSIMALPLLEGSNGDRKLIGILYLENNLAADAFTVGMMEALEIIGLAAAGRLELSRKAVTDGLTGLFNHDFFHQQLTEQCHLAQRYHRTLCILLLDIDHFKKFNDSWGHQLGDTVLRQVADAIRHCCRVSDVVARYGGEEIAVILPETSEAEALHLAERIRKSIEKLAIDHQGKQLRVTASIGTGVFSQMVSTPSALVHEADTSLYACKAAGRNCVGSARQPPRR